MTTRQAHRGRNVTTRDAAAATAAVGRCHKSGQEMVGSWLLLLSRRVKHKRNVFSIISRSSLLFLDFSSLSSQPSMVVELGPKNGVIVVRIGTLEWHHHTRITNVVVHSRVGIHIVAIAVDSIESG